MTSARANRTAHSRQAAMRANPDSLICSMGDRRPQLDPAAVVLPGAVVVGAVSIGPRTSVWYGAILRADQADITIGSDSNVQDTAVVHADPGFPASIGNRVTIGHGAIVHGAHIDDDCIIGMRAVVLNGTRIGPGSLVAAGSVIREDSTIPAGSLVAGVPAMQKRSVTAAEAASIDTSWRTYTRLATAHVDAVTTWLNDPRAE